MRAADAFESSHTERLLLRRPVPADLEAVYAVHADPVTNRYNPAGPDQDLAASRRRLDEWLEHWKRHGFGYWVALDATDAGATDEAEVLGFTGLRHEVWLGVPVLNLYYRFAPAAWGRGLASEAARHAVRRAAEHFPGVPVLARTTLDNEPSQRTAVAAGLRRRPDLERQDGPAWAVILVSNWPQRSVSD